MKIFNFGNGKGRGKKKISYLILFIYFYDFFKLLYIFLLFSKIGENNFYYSLKHNFILFLKPKIENNIQKRYLVGSIKNKKTIFKPRGQSGSKGLDVFCFLDPPNILIA